MVAPSRAITLDFPKLTVRELAPQNVPSVSSCNWSSGTVSPRRTMSSANNSSRIYRAPSIIVAACRGRSC